MKEMSVLRGATREGMVIRLVGVALALAVGLANVQLPGAEPKETTSFVPTPGPLVVPIRIIEKVPATKQETREIPWFSWQNIG